MKVANFLKVDFPHHYPEVNRPVKAAPEQQNKTTKQMCIQAIKFWGGITRGRSNFKKVRAIATALE
ncbi:hypothetical protein VF14_35045 [Nostoc linckia z18]|uniref:Uncharacterized protein n=2 Tax=Nostoc linckia TaxID=92942 RepID=A0A9Q5Z4P1_NOSLI|nr:hypothetical protein [Nostoc linckia]PHJ56381.1 hypothetical protein VF05_37345 [Nostoc linckia z3]PHJ56735.1 hypothetical protein VF03_37250 [Nostoc linckia z2]PHJ71236.1 hypothetical protein VF06_37360 [Nostoc linckia z4]PHJ75607.1 hypothetical protein VF07_37300 [Nostoc linckia z6]PHJ84988.1 hypothetical protein VF04_35970 [Nostoc linckia z7]